MSSPATSCARKCVDTASSYCSRQRALTIASRKLRLPSRTVCHAGRGGEPMIVGERLIGASQHLLGDQPSAWRHIERALEDDVAPDHRSDIIRFEMDQRVTTRVYLGRALWLLGFRTRRCAPPTTASRPL